MYKKNIICSFGSKIFTNFKMAACPSFIKMKRPSFVSQKMKLKKDMLPFWYLWIFLSQNFSLCSPCMYLLTLKRIKQFFNLFVSKKPLKNVSFVWKIGLGRFVFSTTVPTLPLACRIWGWVGIAPTLSGLWWYSLIHPCHTLSILSMQRLM